MNLPTRRSRWTAGLMVASLALAALAPAAQAGHGNSWIRYKHGGPAYQAPRVRHGYAPRRFVVERHSSVAPALIGFLGGLVVGSSIHGAPAYAAPPPDYSYWDPYCHERFGSLDTYYRHTCCTDHPRVVRVIEVRSGDCVGSYEYRDGRWRDRAPDYQDRGYDDRYDDRYDDEDEDLED